MPDLIAQGPKPQDRWRRAIPTHAASESWTIGRTTAPWQTPWDDRISRKHAELRWTAKGLLVRRIEEARNPIFYRGNKLDEFVLAVGEHFVIGQTTFSLVEQRVQVAAQNPVAFTEHTFAAEELRQARYRDADSRIDALSRLPEIILGSNSDEELYVRVANVLLQAIPHATMVALVATESHQGERSTSLPAPSDSISAEATTALPLPTDAKERANYPIRILHWDSRSLVGQSFSPSGQLIRRATETRQSILHAWNRSFNQSGTEAFTQSENVDWAFCTPLNSEACPGWSIYVAGDFSGLAFGPTDFIEKQNLHELQDDLKFAELVATTVGALRQNRSLQRRQDNLRSFFAPVVLQALAAKEPDQVLAPREAEVSVLFCDLRGFSKQSEESQSRLLSLLQRVSDALGVTTHQILAQGGVVGDFHGDAAMGFWGWPLDDADAIVKACRAALAIRSEFAIASAQSNHRLTGFRAGIGIASGRAVAGRIGTVDQVKVTVFGPVVNLASRLEGMTKYLQASILVDQNTAEEVRKKLPMTIARVRRVAKVLPFGIQTPLWVSELLPPFGEDSNLEDEHLAIYENAVDALQLGNWGEAFRLLHRVPADDQVKDFLTVFIAQHGRTPPPDWQGIIKLPAK